MTAQRADVNAALDFLRARPGVDADAVGAVGHQPRRHERGARRRDADRRRGRRRAVPDRARAGRGAQRRSARPAAVDARPSSRTRCGCCSRRGRRYVPDRRAHRARNAVVTAARRRSRLELDRADRGGRFDNRIAAADAVAMVVTSALRHARKVTAPLLVCVCDRENLMDPKYAALVARRAPSGEARHYDSDHFDDLPSAAGRPGARRPDRLPEGASRCPCVTSCAATTDGSCALAADLGADGLVRAEPVRRAGPTTRCSPTWWSATAVGSVAWSPRCIATVGRSTARTPSMARTLAAARLPRELLDDFARLTRPTRGAWAATFRARCSSATTSPTNSTSCFALDREPDDLARRAGRGAEHPSGAAESVRARVPQQPRAAAARDRRRVDARARGARGASAAPPSWCRCWGNRPRALAGLQRRRRAPCCRAGWPQPPDPYGRVMISR